VAVQIDVAQYHLNEGPCLEAARTSQTVRVDLRRHDQPFTRFAPRARQGGIQAVLSVPVIIEAHLIGTVNLYSASAFDPTAEAAAATIANQAAAASGNMGAQLPAGPPGWPSDAAGDDRGPAGPGVVAARHLRPSPSHRFQAEGLTPSSPLRRRDDGLR
jgi:hypothetical protein